jgi:hypothetical protein
MMLRLDPAGRPALAELFADVRRADPDECRRVIERAFGRSLPTAIQAVALLAEEQARLASAYAAVVPDNEAGRCFVALLDGLIHRRR